MLYGSADGTIVKVTPSWNNKTETASTDSNGRWSLRLKTPKAGGPYTITFDDGDKTVLKGIYSGEVWLCSGQSNMEFPVGGWGHVMNYEEEIRNSNNPMVHLLQIKKQTGFKPASDTEVNMGGWRTASPETVEDFSAIAYFYARDMAKQLGVHVGVIDCTWGGTPAEAWTSFDGVKTIPGFEQETGLLESNDFDKKKLDDAYNNIYGSWMKDATKNEDLKGVSVVDSSLPTMPIPCEWEKSVLPDFDGIVWLQKKIVIPKTWEGKTLQLHLGMIDDEDITYYNGVEIARGSGYDVNRGYTVPANLVKAGEAVITVRVTDFGGGGGIYGNADSLRVQQGVEKLSLVGNWNYRVIADFSKLSPKPLSPESQYYPTVLYNAMLSPLHVLPIKGVLWYQGCANVGRAEQYSLLFKRLIQDWRKLWNRPDMPFCFVQLAGYLKPQTMQPQSEWAALRQAQADALALNNTHMAVAIDVGNPDNIHPKNKQEVARRLELITLHYYYGKNNVICDAPRCVKSVKQKGRVELCFDKPLSVDNPQGFIVKSKDGKWSIPSVQKTGSEKLMLSSNEDIESVKYDWADYPNGNLRGLTGLPVAPFEINEIK